MRVCGNEETPTGWENTTEKTNINSRFSCDVVVFPVSITEPTFGQNLDTELWINQFPESMIFGVPVSRGMRALVYMASRDKVDVDAFHKGIQYALEEQ